MKYAPATPTATTPIKLKNTGRDLSQNLQSCFLKSSTHWHITCTWNNTTKQTYCWQSGDSHTMKMLPTSPSMEFSGFLTSICFSCKGTGLVNLLSFPNPSHLGSWSVYMKKTHFANRGRMITWLIPYRKMEAPCGEESLAICQAMTLHLLLFQLAWGGSD